jgi:hypothetical protein
MISEFLVPKTYEASEDEVEPNWFTYGSWDFTFLYRVSTCLCLKPTSLEPGHEDAEPLHDRLARPAGVWYT